MADEMRNMRIRRGNSADFDETKMLAGELAINTDDGVLHACYQNGVCKDLVSMDDVASTGTAGIVQLSSSATSTDEDTAATPKAVKQVYDIADNAASAAAAAQSTADSAASAASAAQSTANSAVQDSGWKGLTFSGGFSNAWSDIQSQYRKIGKMVYLHVCVKGATATWQEIAVLPEGYRPHQSIDLVGRYDNQQHANINISSAGVIQFIGTDGTLDASKQISFAAAYFVE